jgi:hypothetical protein
MKHIWYMLAITMKHLPVLLWFCQWPTLTDQAKCCPNLTIPSRVEAWKSWQAERATLMYWFVYIKGSCVPGPCFQHNSQLKTLQTGFWFPNGVGSLFCISYVPSCSETTSPNLLKMGKWFVNGISDECQENEMEIGLFNSAYNQ